MTTSQEQVKRFLAYLDSIFGVEPKFFPFESRIPDANPVTCMVYHDIPEPGFITGVTFGLSLVPHPEWKFG